MWARVVEGMLGCWLLVSPFVFQHGDHTMYWVADFTAALVVICLALASYWPPLRQAHLGIIVAALAMILYGRFAGGAEPVPALQNHILIGLLLLMFALVPNHASRPPDPWYAQEGNPTRYREPTL